jgi:hypothetical protein
MISTHRTVDKAMVGGPVFGSRTRPKQALFLAYLAAIVLFLIWLLFGCAAPEIRYQVVPESMIPEEPKMESIGATEIPRCDVSQNPCMTDETYIKFVKNNRALKQQIDELRALLGVKR